MAKDTLSDAEAKAILRGWPNRTKKLWSTPKNRGYWLRAQPKAQGSTISTPTIRLPGANLFRTQPDGMWVYLSDDDFADVICIEVCRTNQNLNDKRSRYMAEVRSLTLHCPVAWLCETIPLQRGSPTVRWQACRTFAAKPQGDHQVPIRYLRVLYALKKDLYKAWSAQNVPGGQEYYCRHSSLDSYNSPEMQEFLRRISFASHFYTTIGA